MIRTKFVKVVIPEIVAYLGSSPDNMEPDYRCPECGYGVSEEYVCCPYCGNDLDWEKVKEPTENFLRIIRKL